MIKTPKWLKVADINTKPVVQIFDLQKLYNQSKIEEIIKINKPHIIDTYTEQLEDLYLVRHPFLKTQPDKAHLELSEHIGQISKNPLWMQGSWIFLPWSNSLIHLLSNTDYYELRTSRNKNLITSLEQNKIKKSKIGIAGLSVGNAAAVGAALEGFQNIRIADFDNLAVVNLNRIRAGITDLTVNKSYITAKQIYEVDPYAKVDIYHQGLNGNKLEQFIKDLDVMIDEIDDVEVKIKLRQLAQKYKIPVISAADNGDGVIVDIQRFDLNNKYPIYHGDLHETKLDSIAKMGFGSKIKLINEMVGIEYVTDRMKQSLLEVGKSLYSWPQLGGAAMITGGVLAYLAKGIVLGHDLQSGKYDFNPDSVFIKAFNSAKQKAQRRAGTKKFLKTQSEIFNFKVI